MCENHLYFPHKAPHEQGSPYYSRKPASDKAQARMAPLDFPVFEELDGVQLETNTTKLANKSTALTDRCINSTSFSLKIKFSNSVNRAIYC